MFLGAGFCLAYLLLWAHRLIGLPVNPTVPSLYLHKGELTVPVFTSKKRHVCFRRWIFLAVMVAATHGSEDGGSRVVNEMAVLLGMYNFFRADSMALLV